MSKISSVGSLSCENILGEKSTIARVWYFLKKSHLDNSFLTVTVGIWSESYVISRDSSCGNEFLSSLYISQKTLSLTER